MFRLALTGLALGCLAGCAQYNSALPNPDAGPTERAGSSVALDGVHLFSGAIGNDAVSPNAGKVNTYRLVAGSWDPQASIFASDASFGAEFGGDVDIDGTRAVVGSTLKSFPGDGFIAGAAYVHEFDGSDWVETAQLTGIPKLPEDAFGQSVSVSGDLVAVGAPFPPSTTFTGAGAVYLFRHEPVTDTWIQEALIEPADGANNDDFGYDVALEGDVLAVGSRFDDDSGNSSGSVYVYELIGGVWTESAKLSAFDAEAGDRFGEAVDISDELIVVGARHEDSVAADAGAVYVFERDPVTSTWLSAFKATAFDGAADDEFGKAVAVDDDAFIVGAWLANVTDRTGAAYVFRRRDDGNGWSLSVKPIPDDGGYGDGFGFAVDIDDGCAAVGAPNRDGPGGSFDGATYVTCTLPGIGAETPQLDIDIICCEAPLDPRGPVTYEVRLETDLDRQTVARYRVRLHGPDGESIDLQDREIDYVPGRKPQRDRGELPLTERSKPGLYTLSVYVTDETGQTHIEHERFEHSGRRR